MERSREGFVYILQSGPTSSDDDPIKIGFTRKPRARLLSIHHANAYGIRLLALFRATIDEEQLLLERFAVDRIRGEWFWPANIVATLRRAHIRPPPWTGELDEEFIETYAIRMWRLLV